MRLGVPGCQPALSLVNVGCTEHAAPGFRNARQPQTTQSCAERPEPAFGPPPDAAPQPRALHKTAGWTGSTATASDRAHRLAGAQGRRGAGFARHRFGALRLGASWWA